MQRASTRGKRKPARLLAAAQRGSKKTRFLKGQKVEFVKNVLKSKQHPGEGLKIREVKDESPGGNGKLTLCACNHFSLRHFLMLDNV